MPLPDSAAGPVRMRAGTSVECAGSALDGIETSVVMGGGTMAQGEGVAVYRIGAMPSVHTRWREALVECSGAPDTADADREGFFFHAADGAALDRAFRAIARRVLTFRRVS